jgi:hypothetical protein
MPQVQLCAVKLTWLRHHTDRLIYMYLYTVWSFPTLVLIMEVEEILEALVFSSTLTWLIFWEDFNSSQYIKSVKLIHSISYRICSIIYKLLRIWQRETTDRFYTLHSVETERQTASVKGIWKAKCRFHKATMSLLYIQMLQDPQPYTISGAYIRCHTCCYNLINVSNKSLLSKA